MYDMPAVRNKKLVALLLEEAFPAGCVIEGVDFSAAEDELSASAAPSFLQCYEDIAVKQIRERDAIIENDKQILGLGSADPSTSVKQDHRDKLMAEKKVVN